MVHTKLILILNLILLPTIFSIVPIEECGLKVDSCPYDKYRSITGACNNLKYPNWGTMFSTYDRLIPPKYGPDNTITKAVSGNPLPNARLLTQNIFTDKTVIDKEVTVSCMQYGQLLTHDLSFNDLAGNPGQCCTPTMQFLEGSHDECASIEIPKDDPHYSLLNLTCISVLKTTTNLQLNCSKHLKYMEQISATNSYLDLSVIYGSSDDISKSLRSYCNGTLILDYRGGHEWLPESETHLECPFTPPDSRCYRTGDARVNQNPDLTILHILWAREHNRICRILQRLNPNWDDERLFQETRRITIAEHQYITYYELLPFYLGRKNMLDNGLIYETDGHVNDYDDEMRPNVFNEHAQAAYRHFHGMTVGKLDLVSNEGCPYRTLNIRDTFFAPDFIEERENFDGLCMGISTQSATTSDMFLVSEMTRFAFVSLYPLGFDIKSIDIQRARSHGCGSYNEMRQYCGLKRARHFYHFLDVIDKDRVDLLRQYYEHPDDVDLVVGGSMERKIEGTFSGPTYLCIMLRQFYRTRKSDRFWFENEDCGLTRDQLREIRKSKFSKILCDNGNAITSMQKDAFEQITSTNPRLSCNAITGPNLELWRERYRRYR